MSRQHNLPTSSRARSKRQEREVARLAAEQRRQGFEALRPGPKPERKRFTAPELAEARMIHDGIRWYRVKRVNRKTVAIWSLSAWDPSAVLIDQIVDWR